MTPMQPYTQCGRIHSNICRVGTNICYWCGVPGHMIRDCPRRRMGNGVQFTGSAVASSSLVLPLGRGQQAPMGHDRGVRGVASFSEVQNRTYALGS